MTGKATGIAIVAALLVSQSLERPRRTGSIRLFKDSRAHLAVAIAEHRPTVTLVVASAPARSAEVARAAVVLGGRVIVEDAEIGYLRLEQPTHSVTRFTAHPGVEAAAVSVSGENFLPNSDSDPPGFLSAQTSQTSWLDANRYRPHQDLGVDRLWQRHPDFDGRGITVAVLDGFIDLLLPDFREARDLRGSTIPKVIDQVNVTDPEDKTDPHWVDMSQELSTAQDGTVVREGITLELPSEGTWRLGELSELSFVTNAYLRGDINRDGNPEGAPRAFLVAWSPRHGTVWVDTNQNHDFTDDRPMRDYRIDRVVGVFGQDRPDTLERDSVGFTVTIEEQARAVSINLGTASHGTEISGALAASRSADGLVEGIAPSAALINFWHGSTTHGLIEGALRAFRDPRVDLLVIQQNVFLTMDYALDDGGSVIARLLDRMVDRYGKPAFAPASNIPGPGQLSDVGLGQRVFAVGTYESRASWWTFAGVRVAHPEQISTSGSFGPGGAGQMKPDFIAPARTITPNPGFLPGGRSLDLYSLRSGRAVCGGTSCATPMAAGVAVCLLGAAKAAALPVDVQTLRWALLASARPATLPAHAAGAGVLQADAAWKLLSGQVRPPRLEVRGEVRTGLSQLLPVADQGPGTYIRDRDATRFRVWVRRLDGPEGQLTASVSWRTGAWFRTAATLDLPRGTEVPLDVDVTSTAPGLHSGVLVLADPETQVPWHLSLHAVAVPATPATTDEGSLRIPLDVDRPGLTTIPIRVPEGASALSLRAEAAVPLRLYVVPPDRRIEPFFGTPQPSPGHVVAHPTPGTWLVTVWNATMTRDRAREQAEPARISATLTAAIHEVTSARTTEAGRAEVHNVRGTLQSGARTGALVRRTMLQPAARDGGLMSHEFGVADGAEWLEVALHANGDPADRDLYLMHCPAEKCGLFRAGMGRRANERLFVPNPPAGRWTVVADPLLSTGPLTLTLDIADPALGQVVAHDRAIVRRPGDRWTVSLDTVTGRAPAGTDVITRIPVVAAALEIPAWTAPAAPRGGALSFTPSWFPLAWIEASAPVRRPSPQ